MKLQLGVFAALSWASTAGAHYIFQQLSVGGKSLGVFEGVRKNTNYNSPVTDLKSKDLVCNQGGISGAQTITINVKAGDEFTWTTDTPVYHQGPVSLYISRAPRFVQDYDGSAGWRKIYDWTPTIKPNGQTQWPLYQKYTQTIPKCLPTGEYLLRIQSLGIHNPYPAGTPQFYISCAQLNVTGGPSSMSPASWKQPVSIPGVFKATDPGYIANIYDPNFSSYAVPGGEVMGC